MHIFPTVFHSILILTFLTFLPIQTALSNSKYACGQILIISQNKQYQLTIHEGQEIFYELSDLVFNVTDNLKFNRNLKVEEIKLQYDVYLKPGESARDSCKIQKCASYVFKEKSCYDFDQTILYYSPFGGFNYWSFRCSCRINDNSNGQQCWRKGPTCQRFYNDTVFNVNLFGSNSCAWMFPETDCKTCKDGYFILQHGETVVRYEDLKSLIVRPNYGVMASYFKFSNDSFTADTNLFALEGVYSSEINVEMNNAFKWTCFRGDAPEALQNGKWLQLTPENETIIGGEDDDDDYEDGSGPNSSEFLILVIFIITATASLTILSGCAAVFLIKKRNLSKKLELLEILNEAAKLMEIEKFRNEYEELIGYFEFILAKSVYKPVLKRGEIGRDCFDLGQVLGNGRFASVYRGIWTNDVGTDTNASTNEFAVKFVNECGYYKRSLLFEMGILSSLEPHPNIVSFIGACTQNMHGDELYLLLGFCENGCLKTFLATNRFVALVFNQEIYIPPSFDELNESILSTMHLLQWCIDIANGMIHLGMANIVHIDLAARNVLLTAQNVAKITDFGLSRVMLDAENGPNYVKTTVEPLPPGLAPESRLEGRFSIKSDVWSYGLTLWEIFTLGQEPLEDMQEAASPSQHTTKSIFSKMAECWNLNPSERPTFTELLDFFEESQLLLRNAIESRIGQPHNEGTPAFQKSATGYVI